MQFSQIELSKQTSMFVFLTLGFVFVSGIIWIYSRKKKESLQISLYPKLSLLIIRSLVFLLLCLAIFDFKFETQIEKKQKNLILIFADNSSSMQGVDKMKVLLNFQNLVKIIQSKHLEDEILIYTHSGRLSKLGDLRFNENYSDFQSLDKVVRKLSKQYRLRKIYLFSDLQINNIEDSFIYPIPFVLFPFGGVSTQEQFDFSIPKSKIISVPNELISFPVNVFANFSENQWTAQIELFVDDKKVDIKRISLEQVSPFVEINFSLKQLKVGKHQIKVKMTSKKGVTEKTTDWLIMEHRAKIIGLANAPHPDMGIISRIAKELHIQLDWTYNSNHIRGQNLLIYGDVSIDSKHFKNSNLMLINSTQGNFMPQAPHFQWNLWDSQMQEMLKTGKSASLDSTVKSAFYQSFLNKNKTNMYYLKDYLLNINEPLFFVCEITDSTKHTDVELLFFKNNDSRKSFKYSFSPLWGFNEFRIDHLPAGDFNLRVQNKKSLEVLHTGKIRINYVLPESERGLNLANLQHLRMRNNVEIIEIDQLENIKLEDSFYKKAELESLEFVSIRENALFWLTILTLILLEYLIRKKMGLL